MNTHLVRLLACLGFECDNENSMTGELNDQLVTISKADNGVYSIQVFTASGVTLIDEAQFKD